MRSDLLSRSETEGPFVFSKFFFCFYKCLHVTIYLSTRRSLNMSGSVQSPGPKCLSGMLSGGDLWRVGRLVGCVCVHLVLSKVGRPERLGDL